MKSLIQAAFVTAVLVAPVASFAQTNAPITREQVRAELAQLEKAGYNPAGEHSNYPDDLLAAEARVSAQNAEASGYGGVASGSSQSGAGAGAGAVAPAAGVNALYQHH